MIATGESTTFKLPGGNGIDGKVPALAFARAFEEWVAAFEQGIADLQLPRANVVWVITDMSFGSAVVSTAAQWDSVDGELAAKQCQVNVLNAVSRYQQSGDFGRSISSKTAEHLRRMFRVVGEAGLQKIEISTKSQHLEVLTADDVRTLRPSNVRLPGSVEGEVVGISFAHQAVFTVRDRLDDCLVPCYFDKDQLLSQVRAALLHRVVVAGEVTYRATGEPVSLTDISEISVFPQNDELPTPSDVVGVDPSFTDGVPAEEWLVRQRE